LFRSFQLLLQTSCPAPALELVSHKTLKLCSKHPRHNKKRGNPRHATICSFAVKYCAKWKHQLPKLTKACFCVYTSSTKRSYIKEKRESSTTIQKIAAARYGF
jgi:hypothetical protein